MLDLKEARLPMQPKRQSLNTCSACRKHKVRCDGRRDVCSNCERLGYHCSFGQSPDIVGSLPRRRAQSACLACHRRKIRCNEDRPTCQRCSRLSTGVARAARLCARTIGVSACFLARCAPCRVILTSGQRAMFEEEDVFSGFDRVLLVEFHLTSRNRQL